MLEPNPVFVPLVCCALTCVARCALCIGDATKLDKKTNAKIEFVKSIRNEETSKAMAALKAGEKLDKKLLNQTLDKRWKELPEAEKKEWQAKAKQLSPEKPSPEKVCRCLNALPFHLACPRDADFSCSCLCANGARDFEVRAQVRGREAQGGEVEARGAGREARRAFADEDLCDYGEDSPIQEVPG